jgi:hypothetical protein
MYTLVTQPLPVPAPAEFSGHGKRLGVWVISYNVERPIQDTRRRIPEKTWQKMEVIYVIDDGNHMKSKVASTNCQGIICLSEEFSFVKTPVMQACLTLPSHPPACVWETSSCRELKQPPKWPNKITAIGPAIFNLSPHPYADLHLNKECLWQP